MAWEWAAAAAALAGDWLVNNGKREQAADQRAYQTDMSNTAYQRAMSDMASAGLNPMLVTKLGGASTPGGAQAFEPENYGDGMIQGVEAATRTESTSAQAAQTRAQTGLTKGQTDLLAAQADNIRADTRLKMSSAGQSDALSGKLSEELTQLQERRPTSQYEGLKSMDAMRAWDAATVYKTEGKWNEAKGDYEFKSKYDSGPADWELRQLKAKMEAAEEEKGSILSQVRQRNAQSMLYELDSRRGERERDMYDSDVGKWIPYVREGGRALSTARDVIDTIRKWRR